MRKLVCFSLMGFEVTERCQIFDLLVLDFRVLTASKIDSGLLDDWDDRAERGYLAITQDRDDDDDDDPALHSARTKNTASKNHRRSKSVAAVVTTSAVSLSRPSRPSVPSVGAFSTTHDNGRLEDEDDSAEREDIRLSPTKARARVSNQVSG